MNLEIRRQGIELTDSQRERLTERLEFALGRFDRVEAVEVHVADINGPKAGVDKRCRIHATLRGGQRLMVEELAEEIGAAMDQACDRIGHLVQRAFERRHDRGQAAVEVHRRKSEPPAA